ncbi:hypothetical protein, partial [Neobacillus soli]|uniref:hypothetical protein n=1 Tax=Neobacillus soli TaxID=220688 RepID=UPI001C3F3123
MVQRFNNNNGYAAALMTINLDYAGNIYERSATNKSLIFQESDVYLNINFWRRFCGESRASDYSFSKWFSGDIY